MKRIYIETDSLKSDTLPKFFNCLDTLDSAKSITSSLSIPSDCPCAAILSGLPKSIDKVREDVGMIKMWVVDSTVSFENTANSLISSLNTIDIKKIKQRSNTIKL